MVRVLLTGSGGQLGTDVVLAAERFDDVDVIGCTRADLDVLDSAAVGAAMTQIAPDVIIHAAAYTAVDDCETNEAHAYEVNGVGTANIVGAARTAGARVIYVSTDYVFDGAKDGPYVETDTPNPSSVYGISKLMGERSVAELGDDGLIIRTSWVCGAHGANMVKTILGAAKKHSMLTFVDDQIGKPTFTADLADTLLMLATRRDSGVMHITNEDAVSWFEFCQDVLDLAGLGRERVQACGTDELQPPRPAPRPANSVLDNTRFAELGLPLLRSYREPLAEVLRDLTF